MNALTTSAHFPSADAIDLASVAPSVARLIPQGIAQEFGALAVACEGERLLVAFASTPSEIALARIERSTALRVVPLRARRDQIALALGRAWGTNVQGPALRNEPSDAPAVRAVDDLHDRAFLARSSDIHIEPQGEGARVRFRVDGVLRDGGGFGTALAQAIVSRIKVLAGMDIAERRQPQDGRYSVTVAGHTIDARVSSVPSIEGEKLVIRLLDRHARLPALDELGFSRELAARYREAVTRPAGFIAVCGPTGSGKTTSLYASLAHLDAGERNICSVEDPVEQSIAGATQVQVNAKAGATFASILRAMLRQDPDVIMVGEMRDAETARTALHAALSGRMVLATLHSADAPRAIDRLEELGLGRSSLAAGLSAILAQRLVRRLCTACKEPATIDARTAERLRIERERLYFEARGCERCNGSGYAGRIGIFEFIALDEAIRDAVAGGASSVAISRLARNQGYRPMAEDALAKCREGVTSLSELARVAPAEAFAW
jgi:type II secretory ATPase GspE/PulE/Tfp pilus assembly ATPase PilB-like protein